MMFFLLLMTSLTFAKDCADNFTALKTVLNEPDFQSHWIETTANDGKPLKMDISDREGKLYLEFDKTKEGLWASGSTDVCKVDDKFEAQITKEKINLGKAAPWIMRMSMKSGATFKLQKLKPGVLKISTFGWSGEFVPNP